MRLLMRWKKHQMKNPLNSMRLRKWDYDAHEYKPFEVPGDKIIVLYSNDMNLPINCTNCFKDMTFGDGYTSRTIHNDVGFGYPVCEDCYEKEHADEVQHRSTS